MDFYEQGVERRLAFTPHAQEFTVTCQSDTDWRPEPSEEKVKVAIVRQQLVNLRDSFLRVVRSVAPELEGQKLLHTWATESSRTE